MGFIGHIGLVCMIGMIGLMGLMGLMGLIALNWLILPRIQDRFWLLLISQSLARTVPAKLLFNRKLLLESLS